MPPSASEISSESIIHVNSPSLIKRDEVARMISENQYVVLRGLVDPEDVLTARKKLASQFDPENDYPSLGVDPSMTKTNFQKWAVGTVSPKMDTLPRLFRIFYNPLWCEDIYGMQKLFHTLIEVRNHMCKMPPDYGKQVEEDGAYSACRIQHYPRGGGFMGAHVDVQGMENIKDTLNFQYVQAILVMSKRGVDFKEGGAFVMRNGKKFFYEGFADIGDIALYDGSTVHGVDDIDPTSRFSPATLDGRLGAFVTLFNEKLADEFRRPKK